jgi:hypothetical protein
LPEAQPTLSPKFDSLRSLQQNNYGLTNAMAQDVAAPPLLNPLDVDTTPHTDAVRPEHAGKAAHRDPRTKSVDH